MKKALIIDLDGTLLQTNTFRDYLIFCARSSVGALRWDLTFSILLWVMLRKLRLVTHSAMKGHLLGRTVLFMQRKGRLDSFVESELLYTNQRVKAEVERYRNRGHLLVLATAAPALYAKSVAENFRLDACLATLLPSEVVMGEWHENVGEEKARTLLAYLKVHDAGIDGTIVDHSDDLPLLRLNREGRNLLVCPSEKSVDLIRKEQIAFELLC